MTILILNWRCPKNPRAGGAEQVTLEHAKYWAKNGNKVTWLSGNFSGGCAEEVIENIRIIRYGNPVTIYFLAPFIYWLRFGGNFDLVIDEIHGLPFLSPLWAWKSKKLAFIHEVAREIWDEMWPFPINILGKLYEKIYPLFYKNTPFLTGSNSTKKDLVRYGIDEKNITVIPHGLFLKPVSKMPKKEKKLTLLYVSRLVKMKGIEDAIKIFSDVAGKVPDAQFWIVGNGEENYVNKLHVLVKELKLENSVTFFGYVDEKKKVELYQKSHFLLHTSVREGFGLVVIEANSQGTPVMVFDSPGLKDIVSNGVNGYKYHDGETEKLARKIVELFDNRREYSKLATGSICYANNFTWDNSRREGLQLINSL